jgi:hypothetical protein
MKKKVSKNSDKKYVSKKRVQEIEETFKTLGIINKPYQGAQDVAKNFQRISLYESHGFIYNTSGNTNG